MNFAITILFVVAVVVPGISQSGKQTTKPNKPDFSGKWGPDPKRSEFMKGVPATKITDAVARKEGIGKDKVSLPSVVIEHSDPEFKVRAKSGIDGRVLSEQVYFSDGRGESNTDGAIGSVESKTKWDGKTLVTSVFRKSKPGKKSNTIIARITWELSKDGKTLTMIRTPLDPAGGPQAGTNLAFGVMTSKMVYHRGQD